LLSGKSPLGCVPKAFGIGGLRFKPCRPDSATECPYPHRFGVGRDPCLRGRRRNTCLRLGAARGPCLSRRARSAYRCRPGPSSGLVLTSASLNEENRSWLPPPSPFRRQSLTISTGIPCAAHLPDIVVTSCMHASASPTGLHVAQSGSGSQRTRLVAHQR
jgi:hypothetical protein